MTNQASPDFGDSSRSFFLCEFVPARKLVVLPTTRVNSATPTVTIVAEPGYFIFHVTTVVVGLLNSPIAPALTLRLPKELVGELRRSALLDECGRTQSGITFCSWVEDASSSEAGPVGRFVLRSVFSLDGDVINQVDQALLQHPDCLAIAMAHNRLVLEAMTCLRSNMETFLSLLLNFVPIVVIGTATIANLHKSFNEIWQDPGLVLSWIATLCLSIALPLGKRQMITIFRHWLWRSLMEPQTLTGRMAQWMIGRLMP